MTPVEMQDSLKDHLDTRENFWSGAQLFRRLQDAQEEVLDKIVMQDPTFFVATTDISLVANQATYTLPMNARLGTRFVFTEDRRTGELDGEIIPVDLREYLTAGEAVTSLVQGYGFSLQGGTIRVIPTPLTSISSAFRLWYCPSYGNMLQWKLVGGTVTSTTFAIPTTSSPNYTTTFGAWDPRDDYYNGMQAVVVSGTGAGQIREITDYVGSTRTMTVAAWDTNPSVASGSESTIAIMCPVPERFHPLVVARAAQFCSAKSRTRMNELSRLVDGGGPGRPGMYAHLLEFVQKRQDASLSTVSPMDGGF
jgi:hypothetical protein